jgi:hypothetical protein
MYCSWQWRIRWSLLWLWPLWWLLCRLVRWQQVI